MNPFLKKIAGNTGLGLASGVVILVAGMVRVGLLGRFLDLETFGYLVICVNIVTLLRFVLQIGIMDTVLRFYPEFENENRFDALSSLVVLVTYIALAVTLLIMGLAALFSSFIASAWYEKPELGTPILLTALFSGGFLLSHAATAVLRVQNRFFLAILFPTLGSCLVPVAIWIFHRNENLSLTTAIYAIGLGECFGIVGCSAMAFWRTKELLCFSPAIFRLEPLRESAQQIRSTLGQTSLFGILRSSSEAGGTFLLGLLGTPVQVAILGMSMQLAKPLTLIQSSLGSAISPEITRLHAEGKVKMLYQFVSRYVPLALSALVVLLAGTYFFLPSVISLLLKPEYQQAVPVFLVILASYGLVMAFQPFLPVAIARNEVGRRNLVVCFRFLYLGVACLFGITAMGVALSLLLGNLTIRLLNDLPLYRRLAKWSSKEAVC